jgi:hypothetical protein
MADYRLDMIMNVGRTKRQAKPDKHVVASRLHKSFQILLQKVGTNEECANNINTFAMYLEKRFEDIIHDFSETQQISSDKAT